MIQKSNIGGRQDRRTVNPDWFTGKTWMKVVSGRMESAGQDIYHVHFEGGSRTKLHSHNGDQILLVTAGRGSLELFEKRDTGRSAFEMTRTQRILLGEGDMVHIPAGRLHTHGSTSGGRAGGKTFSHVAINVLPRKGAQYKTAWYESDFKTRATSRIL